MHTGLFKDMSSISYLLAPSLGQIAINGGFSFQKIQLKSSAGQTNQKEPKQVCPIIRSMEITWEPKEKDNILRKKCPIKYYHLPRIYQILRLLSKVRLFPTENLQWNSLLYIPCSDRIYILRPAVRLQQVYKHLVSFFFSFLFYRVEPKTWR